MTVCFDFMFAKTTADDEDFNRLTHGKYATCGLWVDVDSGFLRVVPSPTTHVSPCSRRASTVFLTKMRLSEFRVRTDAEPAAMG